MLGLDPELQPQTMDKVMNPLLLYRYNHGSILGELMKSTIYSDTVMEPYS